LLCGARAAAAKNGSLRAFAQEKKRGKLHNVILFHQVSASVLRIEDMQQAFFFGENGEDIASPPRKEFFSVPYTFFRCRFSKHFSTVLIVR
jgi:hypothetical protein